MTAAALSRLNFRCIRGVFYNVLIKLTGENITSAFLRTLFNIVWVCNPWLILYAHVTSG
jgi:hypothetical protein